MSTNSYSKIKSGSADIDQGNTLATRTFTFRSIRNNVTMTTAPSQLEHGNPIPTSSSTMSTHSSTTQDLLLPETYHLIGIENYNEWAFRMMNILKREGLFKYFISPPQAPLLETDGEDQNLGNESTQVNNNAKHLALCVMKRFRGCNAEIQIWSWQ